MCLRILGVHVVHSIPQRRVSRGGKQSVEGTRLTEDPLVGGEDDWEVYRKEKIVGDTAICVYHRGNQGNETCVCGV